MTKTRGKAAAVPVALLLATVLAAGTLLISPPAQAAPTPAPTPTPGSPAYIARDVANMEAAFGRPIHQVEDPFYGTDFASEALANYLTQLNAEATNPTPSLPHPRRPCTGCRHRQS